MSLNNPRWLHAAESRIGLGCMRLPAGSDRDTALAVATVAAAVNAGIVIFDTAHAYRSDPAIPGQNERLLADALRHVGAEPSARVITKGGMTRAGDQWIPDGRARTIRADCEASLAALDGLPIDLYLVHAPDPRTPWRTTVRALAELLREGLVRNVGVANANRRQLEETLDVVEVAALQVALSVLDDSAVRGGLVELCEQRGIALIAHSPLGGPRRANALAKREALVAVARERGVTTQEVALAWVIDISPVVVAIPGARRPETARSAGGVASLTLTPGERADVSKGFAWPERRSDEAPTHDDGEVVMVMGIPASGKTEHAQQYIARGYLRLNRDERGGSLRDLNIALDGALTAGSRRIVLDNTYLTRATRSHVIEVASRHHVQARCVWVDTPLAQAQVNLVERLLDRYGVLPDPDTLRVLARSEPGILMPTNQMRAYRELEPPSEDEGFAAVEQIPFIRAADSSAAGAAGGVFVAVSALSASGWEAALASLPGGMQYLLFDWEPGAPRDALDAHATRLSETLHTRVATAVCPHAAGPPVCWCRPPLPGLIQSFARTNTIDISRSLLVGTGTAHRTIAKTIGAAYVAV